MSPTTYFDYSCYDYPLLPWSPVVPSQNVPVKYPYHQYDLSAGHVPHNPHVAYQYQQQQYYPDTSYVDTTTYAAVDPRYVAGDASPDLDAEGDDDIEFDLALAAAAAASASSSASSSQSQPQLSTDSGEEEMPYDLPSSRPSSHSGDDVEDDDDDDPDFEDDNDQDGEFVLRHRHSADFHCSSYSLRHRPGASPTRYAPYSYSAASASSTVPSSYSRSTPESPCESPTYPSIRRRPSRTATALPIPVPVPNLTKKSRGRRVPTAASLRRVEFASGRTRNALGSSAKGVRTYMCEVDGCGKCFARGEHLKRHVRSIHTYEKPHKCPYPGCGKDFSRHDNLGQHMRVHKDYVLPKDVSLNSFRA